MILLPNVLAIYFKEIRHYPVLKCFMLPRITQLNKDVKVKLYLSNLLIMEAPCINFTLLLKFHYLNDCLLYSKIYHRSTEILCVSDCRKHMLIKTINICDVTCNSCW